MSLIVSFKSVLEKDANHKSSTMLLSASRTLAVMFIGHFHKSDMTSIEREGTQISNYRVLTSCD